MINTSLTPSELELSKLRYYEKLDFRTISVRKGITLRTVETHFRNINRTLGVRNQQNDTNGQREKNFRTAFATYVSRANSLREKEISS